MASAERAQRGTREPWDGALGRGRGRTRDAAASAGSRWQFLEAQEQSRARGPHPAMSPRAGTRRVGGRVGTSPAAACTVAGGGGDRPVCGGMRTQGWGVWTWCWSALQTDDVCRLRRARTLRPGCRAEEASRARPDTRALPRGPGQEGGGGRRAGGQFSDNSASVDGEDHLGRAVGPAAQPSDCGRPSCALRMGQTAPLTVHPRGRRLEREAVVTPTRHRPAGGRE